ncbi:hypothetical protein BDZ89DRAFT_1095796 [Hymenopellis radicata]|nr:hypothetical protein BDZ89DRAFT_1095818 [Hymenopellis radicata]KAF9003475.1 hypothetical protein BDZ89DRAFT_1095796 [Hymenopellis radicata]
MTSLLRHFFPTDIAHNGDSHSWKFRYKIAKDTISRSEALVARHAPDEASIESQFISEQLPALDAELCPGHASSAVEIVNVDAFTLARRIVAQDTTGTAKGNIVVLNLASDIVRAGGWEGSLTRTQEEALCYSSTILPVANVGPGSVAGVYSPAVLVHRDDLDHNLKELPAQERIICSVAPKLTEDKENFADPSVLEDLRGKIRLVYRMAAHNHKEYLILGAMGCGANILLEDEFRGWFRQVVFAVYSKEGNGPGNFAVFQEVFKDVVV